MKKLVSGLLALVAAPAVFAAPTAALDVTDIVTSFSNQVTPMTSILTAVLGLSVLVAVFGYIKRTAR